MTRLLLTLWLMFAPVLGLAQPATVLTGEHEAFTRVVVSLPPDAPWQLGRSPDGYILRIPSNDGYALTRFFDLIPKTRIAAVSQGPASGDLRMTVGCDCYASTQIFGSSYLVLDIRDGPAPPASPYEVALPDFDVLKTTDVAVADSEGSPTVRLDRLLPIIVSGNEPAADSEAEQPARMANESATSFAPTGTTTDPKTTSQILLSLSEGIGRGLTEGVLQSARRSAASEIEFLQVDQRSLAFPGVRAQTSIDEMTQADGNAVGQTQSGAACLPADYFDVAQWGSDAPPADQIGRARSKVVNAAGEIDSDSVVALARLYIFFGFGREAIQVMGIDGVQSRPRVMLDAIARLIDAEPADRGLFEGQVSCPGNVAVWALLSGGSPAADALVDRTAVITVYNQLPIHVQKAIAPRVAEKLVAIGAQDEALQVLGSDFAPDIANVDLTLAKAALADALGQERRAQVAVATVAQRAPRATVAAMERYFREGIARGENFSDEDFLLADAMRFENRDSPDVTALTQAQILAYVSVGEFKDARNLLGSARLGSQGPDWQGLADEINRQATQRLPDAAFLEFVWGEDLSAGDAATRESVAKRLTALGFPDIAQRVLVPDTGPSTINSRSLASPTPETREAEAASPLQEQSEVKKTTPVAPPGSGAALLREAPTAGIPSLRDSRALVEDSSRSRAEIRALLQESSVSSSF